MHTTTSNVPPRTVSINYHVRAIITNRRARTDRSCIKMIGKRRRMTVINKNLVHGGSPSHSFPLITINYGLSVGPGFVTGKSYEFSSWAWHGGTPVCVYLMRAIKSRSPIDTRKGKRVHENLGKKKQKENRREKEKDEGIENKRKWMDARTSSCRAKRIFLR